MESMQPFILEHITQLNKVEGNYHVTMIGCIFPEFDLLLSSFCNPRYANNVV